MKRQFISLLFCALCVTLSQATTVYTKINNKPADGWNGTYLLVYEKSSTQAYVWNGTDASNNYISVPISNGTISSEDLTAYQVTVNEENTNRYYVHAQNGYIGTDAKSNGLKFYSSGRDCTLQSNGGYTLLETNTNTCRFLCYETSSAFRFRFYYDANKKWADSDKHNICLYVLGEVEQEDPQNQLDMHYAHAEMYACESKFPTQSNPYDQYFMTYLWLAQEEDEESVPQVWLEILAPTQYSLEGTYKSDYTPGKKYFINCQAGAKHSYFIFPNNSEQGWGQAAIQLATMNITKVHPSVYANAYLYHINLVFTDSNKKIWTFDKDIDVYGWWIDCDRSGDKDVDMTPVAFALESGNHDTEETGQWTESVSLVEANGNQSTNDPLQTTTKLLRNGRLYILRGDRTYTITGQLTE